MKGWCPLDDRVTSSKDGRCPECGTPLVALAPPRKIPAPAAATAGASIIGHAVTPLLHRAAVALAIVAATAAAGVIAIELSRGSDTAVEDGSPLFSLLDVEVGETQTDSGIGVRLERVSQRGGRLVASFIVVDGFRDGSPRAASVEVVQGERLDYARTFALGPVTTLNHQRGFTIEAELPIADQPTLALRITTFEVALLERAPDGSSVKVIGGSWRWTLRR